MFVGQQNGRGALVVFGLQVGFGRQQALHRLPVTGLGRQHQRVAAFVLQTLHGARLPLGQRIGGFGDQGLTVDAQVGVGPQVEELLDCLGVTGGGGQHEGRAAGVFGGTALGAGPWTSKSVDGSPCLCQNLDHLHMPAVCGLLQRRAHDGVHRLDIETQGNEAA